MSERKTSTHAWLRCVPAIAASETELGSAFLRAGARHGPIVVRTHPATRHISGFVRGTTSAPLAVRATSLSDEEDAISEVPVGADGRFRVPTGPGPVVLESMAACSSGPPLVVDAGAASEAVELQATRDWRCVARERKTAVSEELARLTEDPSAVVQRLAKGKKLVGLGESAHGTEELWRERLGITERVLSALPGSACVLLEVEQVGGLLLDAYVHGASVSLESALRHLGTAESLAALRPILPAACRRAGDDVDALLACASRSDERFVPIAGAHEAREAQAKASTLERLSLRERSMAANVLAALARHACTTPAVLLAHDKHVSRDEHAPPSLGAVLDLMLGDDYVAVGFLFGTGRSSPMT